MIISSTKNLIKCEILDKYPTFFPHYYMEFKHGHSATAKLVTTSSARQNRKENIANYSSRSHKERRYLEQDRKKIYLAPQQKKLNVRGNDTSG